jgi:hypothetical protein
MIFFFIFLLLLNFYRDRCCFGPGRNGARGEVERREVKSALSASPLSHSGEARGAAQKVTREI